MQKSLKENESANMRFRSYGGLVPFLYRCIFFDNLIRHLIALFSYCNRQMFNQKYCLYLTFNSRYTIVIKDILYNMKNNGFVSALIWWYSCLFNRKLQDNLI